MRACVRARTPSCLPCRARCIHADGSVVNFFLTAAAGSDLFAHQLIWALNSEARPPEDAFNPEVKRCAREGGGAGRAGGARASGGASGDA
jgi:hypothetical protein